MQDNLTLGTEIANHLIQRLRAFVQEQFQDLNLSEEKKNECILILLHQSPNDVLAAISEPVQVISIFLADMPPDIVATIFQLATHKFSTSIPDIDPVLLKQVRQRTLRYQPSSNE